MRVPTIKLLHYLPKLPCDNWCLLACIFQCKLSYLPIREKLCFRQGSNRGPCECWAQVITATLRKQLEWGSAVRKGTAKLKQDMADERHEKILRRKNSAIAAPTASTCHLCARPCKGNAGLQAPFRFDHPWPHSYQPLARPPSLINVILPLSNCK